MVHQFEAEKCLHAALTVNLVLWHYVIGSTPGDPREIQMVQIPGPGLKVGENPQGLPGGDVGAWNWLMHKVRDLSLHWLLQRSCPLIMQLKVWDFILHSSCISQPIGLRCTSVHQGIEKALQWYGSDCEKQRGLHYLTFSVNVTVDRYTDKNGDERDRFIDSFKFMASSLDSLMSKLVRGGRKSIGFEGYSEQQYELLVRKGVYPYEYLSSWDKFEETQVPPKRSFYSNLNMTAISEDDYQHTQKVWKEFRIRNLGEYHDLYIWTDVILPANIFETFRDACLEHYSLDPVHFYTYPGLAWKVCLKKTGIRLELLIDPDMLLMFEHGIRGSVTQAVQRYAAANNKYMGELTTPKEESSYLQYLDANNLHGWAMSQSLPTGGFRWVSIEPNEVRELAALTDKGYLLEFNVSYPRGLDNSHNDLPFMCGWMKINGVEKLVSNMHNKRNYVIHIRALDQALSHGLCLECIHQVTEFNQCAWMKPYIDYNTQLRTKAKNDFEKDFFKLMKNSVFGKTMENIRKHRNIKLITNRESYLRTVMKPNFKSGILFGEKLMGCEMGKIKVVMNKLVYLSQAILDLSKIVMYEFHYDYMKPKYGENLQLCYMDTAWGHRFARLSN